MFLYAEINLISWDREYKQMLWNFIPFKANVPIIEKADCLLYETN